MLNQFTKERSHSNVRFVIIALLLRVIWNSMLHQFMKEISHSNVMFVSTAPQKRVMWSDMLHQFIKKQSDARDLLVLPIIWFSMYVLLLDVKENRLEMKKKKTVLRISTETIKKAILNVVPVNATAQIKSLNFDKHSAACNVHSTGIRFK